LIHIVGKLISKVVANWLSPHLSTLVHGSQSAFITTRYIQDNFCFVQSAARLLHAQNKAHVLLKIDITNAFNSVSWSFLLEILGSARFPVAWQNWMAALLYSATTRIMMNRWPGDSLTHCCGLRQGGPLSPMLFLLVMEVLSALIHKADEFGLLQPLGANAIPHRAALYADDLILFARPVDQDLHLLRDIFGMFEGAFGLGCNLAKCQLVPIRCTDQQSQLVLEAFPCQEAQFPFNYLGVPLSVWKLLRTSLQLMVDKVADKLPPPPMERAAHEQEW
jgi:hypothetical protein